MTRIMIGGETMVEGWHDVTLVERVSEWSREDVHEGCGMDAIDRREKDWG